MTATHKSHGTTGTEAWYLALELGETEGKWAFTIGGGQQPRWRSMPARDLPRLQEESAKATKRCQLPVDAPVRSCSEAGRDGFWLHRHLAVGGVPNWVVDSASSAVHRRQRRTTTDRLDAGKLLNVLLRSHGGERKVWSVVRGPSVADEDARPLHRELQELTDERPEHVNRIKGLLASQGLAAPAGNQHFAEWLGKARLWDDSAVPPERQRRLLRERERWPLVDRQIKDLADERRPRIRCDDTPHIDKVRCLLDLWGVGRNGAW